MPSFRALVAAVLLLPQVLLAGQNPPPKPPAGCVAGDRALAEKKAELARSEYEKCLAAGEPSFETFSNLGIVYAQLNQFDQALKAYTQALALNPDSPPIHMNMGLAYLKTDRAPQAAKEFARTLMGDPDNSQARELLAFCHFQMGEFELAAVEAERVLKAQPEEASAAFLLGSACLRLGLYKRAIPLIYYSVQKTHSPDAHLILGEAFLGVKAYRQALAQFQQAEKLSPDLAGLHAELGTAHAGLGEPEKATAEFEKELAKNPDNFQANYFLGRLKRLANDPEGAKKYLEKADKLRPDNPSVEYEYAVMASETKDYAKAESLLLKVLQQLPSYTDAHVLLASVYFKMHRREDGQREKALADAMKKIEQAELDAEGRAIQKMQGAQGSAGPAHRP